MVLVRIPESYWRRRIFLHWLLWRPHLGPINHLPCNNKPTFHVPKHQYSKYWHASLLIALGTIFGGIHCAGWNLPFHTSAEQRLWRVASLAVTIIPIGAVPFSFIIKFLVVVVSSCSSYSIYGLEIIERFMLYPALAYAVARLVLLGLALALVNHQPPSAFIAIDWTKFYPHIL